MSTQVRREIRLIEEDDGWWSAIDEEVGVASQGETREEALDNLDEVVALHTGEAGEPIEDEEEFLREIGIDPEDVAGAEDRELPEFMQ
ncbi:type II toxin-antitoxin system HicB family antitoxin [Natrarchaeobius chitinivorans]|uniref:Type II toxin-antitoxin system HicB family antitoxin n=1 Tax=Natrarchaeobius chitinivorans TaxID=1679083 RepID=A0A3N6NXC7_NATCH|nr:type II toxin-antitoxin system HicB family antitoxin [Natrarchaeobius chitinivorans]RQG89339.1 type II toxin-antitoxin system HicB family antitoxin [Natrarchaeobius chitinivorans]